jgi:hypothetical protein
VTNFDAAPVLDGLTGFQRRTVEHVTHELYGPSNSRRFLVADETGLGKSLVARGLIANVIERLQHVRDVQRIDIVYVCSNSDIAKQNLSKLDVIGDQHRDMPGRLTLLASHARALQTTADVAGKPVNLVSFTPGTTFSHAGWQTGIAEERVLLFLLLDEVLGFSRGQRRAALELLRMTVGKARFTEKADNYLAGHADGLDRTIADHFHTAIAQNGNLTTFSELVDAMAHRSVIPSALRDTQRTVIGDLRADLARAGVEVLQPDLIILDEFQRFRNLLDPGTESGELAHQLFNHGDAKVLLLSATPYKPFSYAEESEDQHSRDFHSTLRFLAPDSSLPGDIAADLQAYRERAVSGRSVEDLPQRLRDRLLRVMTRQERPAGQGRRMLEECIRPVAQLSADDLLDFVRLEQLSSRLKAGVTLEYWKSTPYFANFCDGYKLAEELKSALRDDPDGEFRALTVQLSQLDGPTIAAGLDVDLGNGKVRALAADTVDRGWWRLLWMPPSLPYFEAAGPYADAGAQNITKRLIFSSWQATPTAIASLISHRSDALLSAALRDAGIKEPGSEVPLPYRVEGGRVGAPTTLALFWPMPGLAELADPRAFAARLGRPRSAAELEAKVTRTLRAGAAKWDTAPVADAALVALQRADSLPAALRADLTRARDVAVNALGRVDDLDHGEPDKVHGLTMQIDKVLSSEGDQSVSQAAVASTLAALAAHAPGSIAWRAISTIAGDLPDVTEAGRWQAAARLAAGLRTLFVRPQVHRLLLLLYPKGTYWQKVLRYCAAGNLQAVIDEYLHHLAMLTTLDKRDDAWLYALAVQADEAISLRAVTYRAFDPSDPANSIGLGSRFALRYGGGRQDAEAKRLPEVRKAFNSPFWPFVLASTSVGQEGIDFHWWCSAIVHWNTPANPVDFEQREGRIDRYGGHAVRRNLAHAHRAAMLVSASPWDEGYLLGRDKQPELGEFAPHWVYPGPAKIERHLSPYPLSVDIARLERLKTEVVLYRLTFGQPRQEDMLDLLARRGVQADPALMAELRIDLAP